jgi:hypothetical protein
MAIGQYIGYTVHYEQPNIITEPKLGPRHDMHVMMLDSELDIGEIIRVELAKPNVTEIRIYSPKEVQVSVR